jgi:anti-sigma factor RsiW
MKCTEARQLFSLYLDSALTGKQMRACGEHLESCYRCAGEFKGMRTTQALVTKLGRKQPPSDLALRLRIAISREVAVARQRTFDSLRMRLQHLVNAFMVPATAGAVTAVIIFGLLIGSLMPGRVKGADVQIGFTPPELALSPFGVDAVNAISADDLVIEAYVDASGRVQDYKVISAPGNPETYMPELNKMMIFTIFRPARNFGQPTSGRAILSFSRVNVKG